MGLPTGVRPISLLSLSLLRLLDSNFPGYALWDMIIPPLKFKIMIESNPLKSRFLVGRLAVLAKARFLVRSLWESYGKVPMGLGQIEIA